MITPRLSVYLDLLRIASALIVLLYHFAYPHFTEGDFLFIRSVNSGSDAVIVFFVLSGFVIAHAADCKDRSLGQFFFQRATRLYSVALPALLLTLACDSLGTYVTPGNYYGFWYTPTPAALVLLYGLTFSNEWGPGFHILGSNSPFWSLSYEAAYYILFAVAFYLRGLRRILLVAVLAALFGLKVLALMPAWLLGVFVYRRLQTSTNLPRGQLWLLALLPLLAYAELQAIGMPPFLLGTSITLLGQETIEALRFSDEFLWNGLTGALVAAHIYGMAGLLRSPLSPSRATKAVRWLAGASFSIYAAHFPILQLLGSVLPQGHNLLLRHVFLFGGTLAACLVFAQLFERNLAPLRRSLTRLPGLVKATLQASRPG